MKSKSKVGEKVNWLLEHSVKIKDKQYIWVTVNGVKYYLPAKD